MTSILLLASICAALLFQLSAGLVGVVWRRRSTAAAAAARFNSTTVPELAAGAWPGWRDLKVVQRHFEDAAMSQCSFQLQPVDGKPLPAFKPGQYLTFLLQVDAASTPSTPAGPRLVRCYSLSDRPDPAGYRITIKRMPPPAGQPHLPAGASSNYFHDHVKAGDVLKAKAPSGRFFIDPGATVPAVFIAGGIGITPLMSMLRWCAAEQPTRAMHLYYGVSNSADHAFKEMLVELSKAHGALQLHTVYSSPGANDIQGRDYQHVGYISVELLRNTLAIGRHQFYVCGPPPMMKALVPALRAWGVDENDINFEAFGPASGLHPEASGNEPLVAPTTSYEIRLTQAKRTLMWEGQDANLLDFTDRHGVPVESGCRSGSCGTCETLLVSGEVHYDHPPDHDIAEGHCLLCVGRPQTALVLGL